MFRNVVGFRVLDERDLCEFWPAHSEDKGWLYEVHAGGWFDLERTRAHFIDDVFLAGKLREYLLVDDQCVNVLSMSRPRIVSMGRDPPGG